MTKPTKRSTTQGTPPRSRAKRAPTEATDAGDDAAAAEKPRKSRSARASHAAAPPADRSADGSMLTSMSPREIAAALNAEQETERAAEHDMPRDAERDARLDDPAAAAAIEAPRRGAEAESAPSRPTADATQRGREAIAAASPGDAFEVAKPAEQAFAERVRLRTGMADILVFRVGGELFGAALATIEEALELPSLSHLPEMPPSMLGVISLRGRMLPAYSPARPLGVALARADAAALVLRAGERRVALAVDDVDDVLTVDLAELRPPPAMAGEERDAVLLGVTGRNGELVSVLDADALVTACLNDQALETA